MCGGECVRVRASAVVGAGGADDVLLRPGYCNTCSLCIISASPKRERGVHEDNEEEKKNTNEKNREKIKVTADIFHLIPQIFCAVYFDIVGFLISKD